jgi:DNA polymerase-3 subunit gamma/tau
LSGKTSLLTLSPSEKEKYEITAHLYTQEQCLNLIDYLIEAQQTIRFAPSPRITLEAILLHVMRSHFQLPIEFLVRKLTELEQTLSQFESKEPAPHSSINTSSSTPTRQPQPIPTEAKPPITHSPAKINPLTPTPPKPITKDLFISEDPTPTPADLGMKKQSVPVSPAAPIKEKVTPPSPILSSTPSEPIELKKKASEYDTIFHFAAVELEGKLQKNA